MYKKFVYFWRAQNISTDIFAIALDSRRKKIHSADMDGSPVSGKDNLEVTGVSRCGRVRKKSSKLVDFQSPDDIDTVKTPKRTTQKSPSTRTPSITQRSSATHHKSTIKAYFQPIARPISHASTVGYPNSSRPAASIVVPDKPEALIDKEIRQLLSPSNHCDDFDNNNDDSDEEYEVDTTMRRSAYMSEKSTKKKIFKDGEIVLSRPQRKDKGKPRFTAYMLWSKEVRHEMLKSNPDMDFAQASRRLSSMWAIVPNNEKNIWRRRAKRVTIKNKRALKTGDKLTTKYLNKIGAKKPGRKPKEMKATSPSKKAKNDRKISATTGTDITSKSNALIHSSQAGSVLPGAYKVTGIGPSDVAAHLKLLGDNLAIIGQRLKEHEGQITVSGSLSVLLDSLLCSLGPLMCLITVIPEVNEPSAPHLKDTLTSILDNIAYVMPGL